jgi:hypothetical protein
MSKHRHMNKFTLLHLVWEWEQEGFPEDKRPKLEIQALERAIKHGHLKMKPGRGCRVVLTDPHGIIMLEIMKTAGERGDLKESEKIQEEFLNRYHDGPYPFTIRARR